MIIQRFFNEVFFDGVYQPVKDLGNGNVCLDVGACTGEFSLWVSNQFSKIYAIEPVKSLYENLKDTVSGFTNIEAVNIALGGEDRNGHMIGGEEGESTLSEDTTPTKDDVPVLTLASFMKKINIDYIDCLKIDIENGEKNVFESKDFEEVADKIKFIIGEHLASMSKDRLESLGFRMRDYKHGHIFER